VVRNQAVVFRKTPGIGQIFNCIWNEKIPVRDAFLAVFRTVRYGIRFRYRAINTGTIFNNSAHW
jgi:hypothetical protein